MMNGQLKPAYNIQFGIENHFIVNTYVSTDRTDYNTLVPIVEKHKNGLKFYLKNLYYLDISIFELNNHLGSFFIGNMAYKYNRDVLTITLNNIKKLSDAILLLIDE